MLRKKGFSIKDPRDVVEIFERTIADFCGSEYAVAVDNLTDGIFLCLKYISKLHDNPLVNDTIQIPKHTYCSVPMACINAGYKIEFIDNEWEGMYRLKPFSIYDAATRFRKDMFPVMGNSLVVLSFQHKKRLCIGKGGMILTNSKLIYDWLKKASFEGRDLSVNQWDDEYSMIGWNMYMTPDDAARGLLIFQELKKINEWDDWASWENYPPIVRKAAP